MKQPFDPYNINFNGFKLDPYRVIEIFQITDPAAQQILKKALRFGLKHKDQSQDMEDIRTSAIRWQEMRAEESRWKNEPELPFEPIQPFAEAPASPIYEEIGRRQGHPPGWFTDTDGMTKQTKPTGYPGPPSITPAARSDYKAINGHRCFEGDNPQSEGLMICADCGKAEAELDEPCRATNGGGA